MTSVIGREREGEVIAAFLDDDTAGARILVLEGDAGIGKTVVWRAGVTAACERGFAVLRSTVAETESRLSFTALRDLLDPVFDQVADELPAPQRRALMVTLLREEPPRRPLDLGAIGVAFARALQLLLARDRVLIAVDDVHWLDPASATVIAYALRRVDDAGFAALLARRPDQQDALGLGRLERVRQLQLGGLTLGALGRILHDELGVAYPRPILQRISETSAGNPFFALELARALGERGHTLAPGAPLPVPSTLYELVSSRLEALPPETLGLLTYAAAASRPLLSTIAAAASVEPEGVLRPAVTARIVTLQGEEIRFSHPLFAGGVYALADPAHRREVHRGLAGTVGDEEGARHLALASVDPDEQVASALESVAARTRIRGDRVVSAQLFEDAARLTPKEDATARARRTLAGAGAMFEAGDSETARTLLEAVVADPPEGDLGAEARWRLGTVLAETGSRDRPLQLWREALHLARDPSLAAEIESSVAVASIYAGDGEAAGAHAERALTAAEASGDPERLAFGLSTRALAAAVTGEPSYASFVERALALESTLEIASSAWTPSAVAGECALLTLDLDEATEKLSAVLADAVETGNVEMELWAAHRLATARIAAGDFRRGRELAEVAAGLAETTGVMRLPTARLTAEIDAHFGDVEPAVEHLEQVCADAERQGWARHLFFARVALGAIRLARDESSAAADELLAARLVATQSGIGHSGILVPFVDEVESAARAGRPAQARDALAAARRFDNPPSWAEPLLLRADAAVRAEPAEMERMLQAGAAHPASAALPLQHGRTLLALGSVQRRLRKRRAARETLHQAQSVFRELGAELWSRQTQGELERIGGRAPSSGELTATEKRVAELVAAGQQNKEVAATLVVSVHTVEATLTRIYQKLEIRSRTELAARLSKT